MLDARTSTIIGGALFALVCICVTILVALHDLDGAQVVTIATPLLPTVIGALGLHAAAHTMAAGPEPIAAAAATKELARFVKARAARSINPPPLPLFVLAALCLFATSCTPAELKTADTAIAVIEDVCVPIASVASPAEEPLCVTAGELAQAVASYIAAHAGTPPTLTAGPATSAEKAPSTFASPELYELLAGQPKIKARRATSKPCPKLPAGTVAP